MTEITDGVRVTGSITPTDTTDTYPTHSAEYGKGGHRTVADTAARDAIPTDRREEGMLVFVADTGLEYRLVGGITNSDWSLQVSGGGFAGTSVPGIVGGRLTAANGPWGESGGSNAIYFRPAISDQVSIYDALLSEWMLYSLPSTGISYDRDGDDPSDPSDPSGPALSVDTNYDVFVYVVDRSAGTLALWLEEWTSDTVRAVELVRQDGILVHGNDPEFLFLGTVRTIDDSGARFIDDDQQRFVWNNYNQTLRVSHSIDSTGSWTELSATWTAINSGNAAWKYEWVDGSVDSSQTTTRYAASVEHRSPQFSSDPVERAHAEIGVGLDSTTTLDTFCTVAVGAQGVGGPTTAVDASGVQITTVCQRPVGRGYHFMQAIARRVTNSGLLVGSRTNAGFHASRMA